MWRSLFGLRSYVWTELLCNRALARVVFEVTRPWGPLAVAA
jgi:hypothetical protein